MKLIIEDDEGHKTVVPFAREEITIGRQEGNTIRLTERNISRRHARLVRQNGHVVIEDLGSYNGIRVNGEKIGGKAELSDGDLIQIGDYDLAIQDLAAQASTPANRATIPAGMPAARVEDLATELESPLASDGDDIEATAPSAQAYEEEPTERGPPPGSPSRRESTSIIRVDQLEGARGSLRIEELDASEAPRLVVLTTELAGREFSCLKTEVKVGRTEENDLQIEHRSLSRTHCKIARDGSGEWKISDLQSANGITINGEQYAQATLNHLDVIELGHVKLRFVGPGQSYTFQPGDERSPGGRRLPVPVIAGIGGGLLLFAVVGVFAFGGDEDVPAARPVPVVGQTAELPQAKPAQAKPAQEQTAQEQASPEPSAPVQAEAPAEAPARSPKYQSDLSTARAAVDARQFERALPILERLKADNAPAPEEVQELLDQSIDELAAKDAIGQAVKQLGAGRLEQASELLDRAQATVAFADDLERVRARINSALAAREAREIARASAPVRKASATAPRASPQDEARRAFEDGTALFKKKQYREAIVLFDKCLGADASFVRCHMMLGSTHAKLKNIEEGARHYRMFVKLSPKDDPEAIKVQRFLEEYEASKK